jgi:uncharacterized membrane protein YeaQ/YmgE (transglycosylase-associated protein family)
MTLPAFLFGFCIATLLGSIFHLLRDGGLGRLLLDLILSWVGFTSGHFLANKLGWAIVDVGPLHLGMAILGSIVFLVIGHWLSQMQVEKRA